MSSIHPIKTKARVESAPKPRPFNGAKTASKVATTIEVPQNRPKKLGLFDRTVEVKKARKDAKEVQTNWHVWDLDQLAEAIIGLEDRVEKMDAKDPEVRKVQTMVENLHFQFIFPIVSELKKGDGSTLPTFRDTISSLARKIFQSQNLNGLNGLNRAQIKEVSRFSIKHEGG